MVLLKSVPTEIKRNGDKQEADLNTYVCDWCGNEFKQIMRTSVTEKGKGGVSNQVKCPSCNKFIKSHE